MFFSATANTDCVIFLTNTAEKKDIFLWSQNAIGMSAEQLGHHSNVYLLCLLLYPLKWQAFLIQIYRVV